MFCEIYLQSAAYVTTIHDLFIYFFSRFLNRSLIPDPLFLIPDPPSSILVLDFPVNLEVLLIKIVLFSTTEVINCSKVLNAFKR